MRPPDSLNPTIGEFFRREMQQYMQTYWVAIDQWTVPFNPA